MGEFEILGSQCEFGEGLRVLGVGKCGPYDVLVSRLDAYELRFFLDVMVVQLRYLVGVLWLFTTLWVI